MKTILKYYLLIFLLFFGCLSLSQPRCRDIFDDKNIIEAKKSLVIGAGAYGTAFAQVISSNFKEVFIYNRTQEPLDDIENQIHKKLDGVALSKNIIGVNRLENAAKNNFNLIVFALPVSQTKSFIKKHHSVLSQIISKDTSVISLSKGIETESLNFVHDILLEELKGLKKDQIYLVSGPSYALEMSQGSKTQVTLAGNNKNKLKSLSSAIQTNNFKLQLSTDMNGTAFSGAIKNAAAIASGIIKGLNAGDNPRAAVILSLTQEFLKINKFLGGHESAFIGPAYLGDLILSLEIGSRNTQFGISIGEGMSVNNFFSKNKDLNIEGFGTVKSLYLLAKNNNISTPVIDKLYKILYEQHQPLSLLESL